MIQSDPSHTVQAFIDLIQRHEQSFYYFVHKVHSKGEGLFNSLMQWVEMFLTVVREGLGDPLSLEFLLPHTGLERTNILSEVDEVAMYHYKLKVMYEDKLRRRFGNAQGQRDVDAEDEATQTLVNNVLGEINFGELADGDALDVAAEESDEFDDEYTSSDDDRSTDEEGTSSEDSESEEDSMISRSGEEEPRSAPACPCPTAGSRHESNIYSDTSADEETCHPSKPVEKSTSIFIIDFFHFDTSANYQTIVVAQTYEVVDFPRFPETNCWCCASCPPFTEYTTNGCTDSHEIIVVQASSIITTFWFAESDESSKKSVAASLATPSQQSG